MNQNLLVAAVAFAVATGCATTGTTSSDDTRTGRSERGTQGSAGGGKAADPSIPKINAKAMLEFESANKAADQMRKSGKWDYAALDKRYEAAFDADSALAEAAYNRGVLAERQGKIDEAKGHYREALNRKPSLRQAQENLIVIQQNSGDVDGAAEGFKKIIEQNPDDAGSRARYAEILRRRGQNEDAIMMAKEALFRDPRTLQAYKTMMLANYELKQYSMAKLIALRASKLDDNDPEIYFTLGRISLDEKDPVKARVQFKRAVHAKPDYLPAHLELAKMAMAQEDYAGAEESFRRILQRDGKNIEAMLNLGVAYKGIGQYDKALAVYEEVHKLNPNLPAIYLNKGIITALKGDPEKAIGMFKQYISMAGETALPGDHAVFAMIKEQEDVIAKREEDKRAAEEAARMEAEMKKQEDAAKAEEKKMKEEELKKQQEGAKAPPPEGKKEEPAPAPAAKKEEKKKEAPKAEPKKEEKKPAPAAKPAGKDDEPDEPL